MPTIEISHEAWDRLVFLSAQIGHPLDRHCAEWIEKVIFATPADSEAATDAFARQVDEEYIEPGKPFTEEDVLCDGCWGNDPESVRELRLAITFGLGTGRLRDTRDGYVLVVKTA